MTNGATPFKGNLLLVNSGRGALPPNIALVNPFPPFNSTVILDNYFGRQFNSLNDAKIHPKSKAIFFTDVTCVLPSTLDENDLTVIILHLDTGFCYNSDLPQRYPIKSIDSIRALVNFESWPTDSINATELRSHLMGLSPTCE